MRRADGQTIQLTELLYLVAEAADGQRDFAAIAEVVGEAYGKTLSPENVEHLVDAKLRPLGVLTAADGSSPPMERPDALLALKFKTKVVPERVVRSICVLFKPLFPGVVVVAVLGGLVAFDIWLFFVNGVGEAMRDTLYAPGLILLLFALVVLGAALHECGHAAGCAYSGARPGVMGAGLYFVWPAFYTDVTDSYRLGRAGRLRTDLGGVYFNFVFILATAGVYFLTGFEPLLLVIVIQHLEVLHQLLPFLRLDGYYILADLTGVPDLFTRIKDILVSLVPGREPSDRVKALKPWVRAVASGWVLLLVPVIAINLVFLLVQTPRILATAWDSLLVQWDTLGTAAGDGKWLDVVAGAVQTIALVLPVAGLAYTFARLGRRLLTAGWRRTEGRPLARGTVATAGGVAIGLLAFTWYPNGDYRPLQPGERLQVQEVARTVTAVPSGRPGLTAEREAELGGARTVRSGELPPPSPTRRDDAAPGSATTTTTVAEPSTTTTSIMGRTTTTEGSTDTSTRRRGTSTTEASPATSITLPVPTTTVEGTGTG
ncbi:MAG TPA: hypothetical protein VNT56_00985 [Acidimicrobiales bacterium]|nr:hypothetical protein [Acidimicrobiales bacterium]